MSGKGMELTPGLQMEQKLHLAPQMQYALTLLQMDADTLLQHIQKQAMENPLIALDSIPSRKPSCRHLDDKTVWEIPDRRTENTLRTHLMQQIPLDLDRELRWAVRHLIDALDPSGYFKDDRENFAESLGIPSELLERALALLHGMDPPGVGAFSLAECLKLQLDHRPDAPPLARRIADTWLHDAAAGRLRKIAREENTTLRCVEEAFAYIRTLSPYPASGYHSAENDAYILPDVIVACDSGELSVALTDWSAPTLRRNSAYAELLMRGEKDAVFRYLQEQAAAFTKLEQAIAMRSRTLLSVTRIIVDRQRDFFLNGSHPLRPLSLRDISQEVDLHVSTVSRAIRDKYLSCPLGVFPLRHFLSRYIPGEQQKDINPSGQDYVLRLIQELIEAEDPSSPLSDQQIYDELKERKVTISRRSVANYREKLSIPSSYVRKKTGIPELLPSLSVRSSCPVPSDPG